MPDATDHACILQRLVADRGKIFFIALQRCLRNKFMPVARKSRAGAA
jgi:hypothetical protein